MGRSLCAITPAHRTHGTLGTHGTYGTHGPCISRLTGVSPVHLCCVQPGGVWPDETLPRQSPRPVQDCVRCPPVGRGGEVWASGLRGDAARLADCGRESHRQQLRGLPRPGGQQRVLLRVQEEQRIL